MSTTQGRSPEDHNDRSKSRASKACARCRLKKARCSGGVPCTNCRLADAVCHFGNFQRSQRKMFPEHYVRALEAQQHKLEVAVHTMYYRLIAANAWPGPRLMERDGNPLLHEILAVLGLLESSNDDRAQTSVAKPENEEHQNDSPSAEGSLVASPEEQYQIRRNSAPTPSQEVSHSRNPSSLSQSMMPEEARWFGGIPGLLSRTTGVQSLVAPRRMDFAPPLSSASKPQEPSANVRPGPQSLSTSFGQQQTFVAAQGLQSAAYQYPSLEGMDWNLLQESADWWYEDPGDPAEQQVAVAGDSSETQEGPCELDGLWQSSQDRGIPQATSDDDDGMDRALPTHFFKIGW
ncbi:unnamed protein product [Aureobasidium mustum]|uniref:Zn(2)-C6 fungal-type domain-containing protein n=1 Tax=Aureobasidium mustum TaxID=2773714 RepID=A0A9N8JIX5_9PEZI|nr:unnamed protein product [Aureobasidium mustum]